MKHITFISGEMPAGLANMLEQLGFDTDDRAIALGMEAPYLFVHEDGRYRAGVGLFQPKWFNLYLHPLGFHMAKVVLAKAQVGAFLRSQPTAMLYMQLGQCAKRLAVYTGYAEGRYCFINIKTPASREADSFTLSLAMLKRRLGDNVAVYTLEKVPAQAVDFLPLLESSLEVLKKYRVDLFEGRARTVSREELRTMHTPLFRPLMQDLLPLQILTNSLSMEDTLLELDHRYRHIFTENIRGPVLLAERLHSLPIRNALQWLTEEIIDRMYAHTTDSDALDRKIDGLENSSASTVKH